jgi:IS30 family transposase
VSAIVADKLQEQWSPQQVAGWLKITFDGDETVQISHGTIYQSLFIQACGVLKKELLAHLRSRRIMWRGKTASTAGQTRGQIIDAASIRDRHAEIEDRAAPGHHCRQGIAKQYPERGRRRSAERCQK